MSHFQGGKKFGQLKAAQEQALDEINARYQVDPDYNNDNYPDLEDQLQCFKKQFMEFDEDHSGDIDIMELKRMMEKLGQAKTHLELKKMIAEVDRDNTGTISYDDFLIMMLGKKSSILKIYGLLLTTDYSKEEILMFEEKGKPKEKPKGVAPKRDLASLP